MRSESGWRRTSRCGRGGMAVGLLCQVDSSIRLISTTSLVEAQCAILGLKNHERVVCADWLLC